MKNVCHFFAVYVIRPATIEGARNDIHGAGMTYTGRGPRPTARRSRAPDDIHGPASTTTIDRSRVTGRRSPARARAPRPADHGPRTTDPAGRSRTTGNARELTGRGSRPGWSTGPAGGSARAVELEGGRSSRRRAAGSHTGRRSGELEGGPSSTGAAPGGRKKKGPAHGRPSRADYPGRAARARDPMGSRRRSRARAHGRRDTSAPW